MTYQPERHRNAALAAPEDLAAFLDAACALQECWGDLQVGWGGATWDGLANALNAFSDTLDALVPEAAPEHVETLPVESIAAILAAPEGESESGYGHFRRV